uniref:XrtA/PEP-CTERM system TPR-repeat protein PrsT n=1 Tax=Ningiella ruwaisensis TaxID=2364274 RepID=UPI00144661F7|nr:XrtA/PEP-CTERM system TPR-repeat protein PrsT [Ningiella ruwaisensis]
MTVLSDLCQTLNFGKSLIANKVSKGFVKIVGVSALSLSLLACTGKTAEEHIQQAQSFVEQGDANAAIVELKSAIQENPRMAQARFELGKIYIAQNSFESAEKELSRALELGHPPAQVIPLLSQAYQRTGANVALADLEFDEENLTTVERLEVNFRKLQSLIQLEKNAEARALIDEMSALDSSSVYKDLIESHRAVLDQDYEMALAQAIELHDRAPLNRDILAFTARLYMINGDEQAAANMYEEYIKVAGDDVEAKFALANMLVQQEDSKRAETYIDELLLISDTNPFLNKLKAIVRAADNDFQAAFDFSEKAILNGSTEPQVRMVAGFAAYQLGDFEEAINNLTVIAPLLPDGHPGLRILAASQLQSDMGTEASEVLERIGDVTPEDASLLSRAGYELIQEGNVEAAQKVIAQADKISESAADLTRLGILKLSLNDVEGLLNLEQAVEKAPESVTAKTTLASAYLGTNQLDKALELAKEWQQEAPSAAQGYLLESEVLQREGKFIEAEAILNKIAEFAGDTAQLKVAKIRLYLRQENIDKALEITNALLQENPQNVVGLASFFAIKSQAGEREAALNKIKAAFDYAPEDQALSLLLARVAVASGQPQMALTALDSIEANRGAPNQYWTLKGISLVRSQQIDEAQRHYAKWAELFPKQEAATIGRLLLADGKREYQSGINIATKFLESEDNVQVRMLLAHFHAMLREVDNAKQVLAGIAEQYQALPYVRGIKARIALLENRPAQAIDDAQSAYAQSPNTDNLFIYSQALFASGQQDASYNALESHVERFPNDVRAKLLLAERQIENDSGSAIANYREVLELAPNNFVVLNNLAYLLMQNGELADAAKYAEQAYEMQPDNVATADTYAQVLVRQNKTEEALDVYARVMSDKVTNEEVVLNYVEALLKSGSMVAAKRRLESTDFTQAESSARARALIQEYNL